MKLRAIVPDEDGNASTWWRIERPFALLGKRKHDVEISRNNDIASFSNFRNSICIVHRLIPSEPISYIKQLRRAGAKVVAYSLDDLTIDREALRAYLAASGGLTTFAIDRIISRISVEIETINLCDVLIVSTKDLANLVCDLVQVPVIVLENALDIEYYTDGLDTKPLYIGQENTVYIGYASGRRPESDLEAMAKAWGFIGQEFSNVKYVVAGVQHDIIDKHIDLERKIRLRWQPLDCWGRSMQVDIGCCPLADTKFNEGKSPIKYYEYSMAGAAVVASDVVYMSQIISHVNGYTVQNDDVDDWLDCLADLVESKLTRQRMQANAQYDITMYQSLQAKIGVWENELEALL